MDFITARLPSMHAATSTISRAALTLVGASCAQPISESTTTSTQEQRSFDTLGSADRRRTASGSDDQHLYTVNL